MTVHITLYSDMLELQQRGTKLLLVIKFRLREENMKSHTSFFLNNSWHCLGTWWITLQELNAWCLQCAWQSLLHTWGLAMSALWTVQQWMWKVKN